MSNAITITQDRHGAYALPSLDGTIQVLGPKVNGKREETARLSFGSLAACLGFAESVVWCAGLIESERKP